MVQSTDARDALVAIAETRKRAIETRYPIGYDLIYGIICAALVAGQGLSQPWSMLVLVGSLVSLALLVRWWRDRCGWWVSGYSPKRARWVAYGLVAVFMSLIGLSLYGRFAGPDWLFLVSGALGFVSAVAGGRLWMWMWRKDLGEGLQ